eukprot:EC094916.1.p2 GENE.EC094916.1~~EC094916.1.p2  ORF type:complete len:106 (-),score=1.11 EC094916.1:103-420(-)
MVLEKFYLFLERFEFAVLFHSTAHKVCSNKTLSFNCPWAVEQIVPGILAQLPSQVKATFKTLPSMEKFLQKNNNHLSSKHSQVKPFLGQLPERAVNRQNTVNAKY